MTVSELVKSVDLLEYISQYMKLEEKNGEFWGLSPFNDEKTPSFSIRKETNTYYDFSAGVGGGIIDWIKRYNKCSSYKAIEILKNYTGTKDLEMPEQKIEAIDVIKRFLPYKKQEKQIKSKPLSDDYMERYADDESKLSLWESEGISKESLKRFQVRYDSLSDRLVYPVRNLSGEIINLQARILDPEWKSKGLRKYTYYFGGGSGDSVLGLYENMDEIVKRKEVIIFEGLKSVLLASEFGFPNGAALLTSHLSYSQMKTLARLSVSVTFALDKGVKIRDDDNVKRLRRYAETKYITDKNNLLEGGMSPVDKGIDTWKQLYDGRTLYK